MNGSVKIINYNANADSIVAAAGRISTTQGSAEEIYKKSCENEVEANQRLIMKILSSGHKSVLEHISVNLAFDNVSVFVEEFMIEFRLASFTVKSRRYVDFGKMGYFIPDFMGKDEFVDEYKSHMDSLFAEYDSFTGQGVPKEDARFILPYCFKSNFYCTLNARELEKVMSEMVYGRGKDYPELVTLGKELYRQCEEILPYLGEEKFAYEDVDSLLAALYARREQESGEKELVSFVAGPENPEQMICRAAALNHGFTGQQYGVEELPVELEKQQKKLLKALLAGGRKRELEQAHFTFRFNRISLAGVTHLVRHRMQSIVIPDYSQIYDFSKYIVPQSIVDAGLTERYREVFRKTGELLSSMEARGMNEKYSVYFMLSGMTIPVLTTMNGNELETFMRLRTCNRAQWEIKACADELLRLLREKYPMLFSLYGPGCYMLGYCPEGKMTCGRKEEMVSQYKKQ